MATYGFRPPKAPTPPRVSTGYQTQRQTTGYRDPFPSLSQAAAGHVQMPRTQTTQTGAPQARPPAPAMAPAAAPAGQPQPALSPTPISYVADMDPTLNQIQALSSQGREDATSNALALRRQLAQSYGDQGLARQYGGDAEATAAANNPNSVLAQLSHSYDQSRSSLENQLNQNNLFYSGARVKQLGDLEGQYQSQLAGATGQEQGALGDITSNLAAALHSADLQDAQAQQDAYGRSLQAALAAGGTGLPGTGVADPTGGGVVHPSAMSQLPVDPFAQAPDTLPPLGGGQSSGFNAPIPQQSANPIQSGIIGALAAQLQPAADPRQAGILNALAAQLRGGRPTRLH